MDDKIIFLYAQGMTTREIVTTIKEMYGADVSAATLIPKVTDAVIEQVIELNGHLGHWMRSISLFIWIVLS